MNSLHACQWSGRRFGSADERRAIVQVLCFVPPYNPPDPTLVEVKPEALDFWSRTLETPAEKIKQAVQKVGPVLETVKKELGIGGPD